MTHVRSGARSRALAIVAVAGLLLAACGGDDSASSNAGVTTSTTEEESTTTSELTTETTDTTLGDGSPTTIAETGTTLPGGTPTTTRRRASATTTTAKKGATTTTARPRGGTPTTTGSGLPADADPNGVMRVGFDLASQGGLKFDPTTMGAGQYIYSLPVLRTLLTRTADGEFKPDLAQSARVVNSTTVEVTLRPNMKFGDGTDLDATAIKKTFERNLASNNANGLQITDMQVVKSVVATSPTKATINLNKPSAGVVYALLAGVEFAPMSPKSFTDGTNLNTGAIGAGPMRLTKYLPNQRVEFEKNPYYWDAEHVYLAGMTYVHTPAGAAVINALRSGQVDIAAIQVDQAQNMQGALKADFTKQTGALTIQWCIRDGQPLGNVKVRQAVNHAINRDAFNGIIYGGRSSEAWDLFPPTNPLHDKSMDNLYPHSIAKAKQLLSEAGYPNGFKFSMVTSAVSQTIAEVLQSQLKEAGIDMSVNISNNSANDYQGTVKFESSISQSRPGPYDKISRFYLSDSFSNACKYPNPRVDSLYARVSAYAPDDPAAAPLWKELSNVLFRELAFFPQIVWFMGGYGYNTDNFGKLVNYYEQLGGRQPDPVGTYMKK